MNVEVRITKTDTGSNTRIRSENDEASKDYASWDKALAEAERLGLVSGAGATAAKLLPPGMPYITTSEVDAAVFSTAGFVAGKAPPAQ